MTADAHLRRLTALGLMDPGEPGQLDDALVDALLALPDHEGAACLLGAAAERGHVLLSPASQQRVTTRWAALMARVVHLDAVLLEIWGALDDAGIPTRVLKGAAIASLDEPDPAWRAYSDVDLLVPADRLMEAARVVAARCGTHPVVPPVRGWWADRFAKGITLVHLSGIQVDLHRLLAAGPIGARLRPACLFQAGRPFRVGGHDLVALADAHRFLHACVHAVLGATRGGRHRRDVLLLASQVKPSDLAPHWVDGWSPAVVDAALRWAAPDGAGLPEAWHAWDPAGSAQPKELQADQAWLARDERAYRRQAGSQLSLRRPLRSAGFAAGLLWPSRAHLQARGLTRRSYLARLAARR